MKQHRTRAALLVALAGVVGVPAVVAAQEPAPAVADFSGTWVLAQVDSADLPVQFDERDNCTQEVTSATLTIQPDNTWRMEARVRETCGQAVTEETTTEEGKFAITADGIDFDPDDMTDEMEPDDDVDIDELATGTVAANMLEVKLEDAPRVLMFHKQ